MVWTLLRGDVREKLAELPEKSVQCVVTSPPYWGLRSYLPDGHEDKKVELGLEKTPEEYVANMVEVFRGVWRVLRDDGVVWLNLGDSYAGNNQGVGTKTLTAKQASNRGTVALTQAKKSVLASVEGLKPKDLVGIPWAVAFALRADGWYLRSDIIWAKPNPMPESVTDRPTKSHEYIFLLAKSARYYYDAEAIREPNQDKYNGKRGDTMTRKKMQSAMRSLSDKESMKRYSTHGRNKRTVWTISTQPYPEAHFATFPPKLIEPCILAGTSPRACEICGAPWERVVEREPMEIKRSGRGVALGKYGKTAASGTMIKPATSVTTGWQPTCTCKENSGKGRCIILDPFAGSGTTLYVAERYGRDSVGIELSEEYCKLIHKRMDNMQQTIFGLGVQ